MQITSDIFQVGGSGFTHAEDAAVYLIKAGDRSALVDAGCGSATARLMKNIKSRSVKPGAIDYLLITHCHFDHVGGAKDVRAKTRCKIVAHELDASFLEHGDAVVTAASWYGSRLAPFSVDIRLSGDRRIIRLGDREIEAIHIPGHSPGSVAYMTESDGLKVLFAQDVHGPLAPSLLSDEDDYQASLEKLLALDADILCEGHYGVFKEKAEIQQFIRSFMKKD